MTEQEFAHRTAKTQSGRHRWTEDETVRRNRHGAGDYLRNAELDAEQNYNMAPDGLLNNIATPKPDLTDGQTWDELRELAPETLPEEIQHGGKPSLIGQVEQHRAKPDPPAPGTPDREPEL